MPTPFLVGRVNCYLIEDEPLTLVDTGPNSGKSLDELERALQALGHSIEDLELIVLTHQHMDHLGLLEILARRSGAEVAALHLLAPVPGELQRQRRRRRRVLDGRSCCATACRPTWPPRWAAVGASFRAFGSSGEVTRPLRDGDELRFADRTPASACTAPGTAPRTRCSGTRSDGLLIAGDHLLAHISSNPLISRPLDGACPSRSAPDALVGYIASMRATRELAAELVLPGHGDPVLDHARLIDERLRMHERRARKLLRMLEPAPLSAYELATGMWGNVAVTQAFLTISEVLGHMDLLIADGAGARGAGRSV